MKSQIIETGVLTIENQILKIGSRTINIASIDTLENMKLDRYSLTSGIGTWIKGFIVVLIIAGFIQNNITALIFTLYLFSIVILLAYNIYQHKKQYYALMITTTRSSLMIRSNLASFIDDIENALHKSLNSKKVSYTINLDNKIINHGIISKGNNNNNEVKNNDNNN